MTIRYRFLLSLIGVVVVFAAGTFALHHYQVQRSAEIIVSLAQRAARDGRHSEAVGYYRQYFRLRADDATARAELGRLLAKAGDLDGAYFELESALRGNPTDVDVRRELVEVSLSLGRYHDAKTQLTQHLLPTDPENAEFHYLLGRCAASLGEYAEARSHFESATRLAAEDPQYAAALASLLSDRLSDVTAARRVLDELISQTPENVASYVARGRWLLTQCATSTRATADHRQANLDAAWTDTMSALGLDPVSAEAVELAVDVANRTNRSEQIRPYVAAAIEATPGVAALYCSAAQIELQAGRPAAAKQWLTSGLQANPRQPELMYSLAQLELRAENRSAVETLIAELRSIKFADAPLRYLEAQILVSQGQWRPAVRLIEDSRALFDRSDDLLKRADFLLATCYQNLGNFDQQLSSLRRAVGLDPLWQPAREGLAQALFRLGRLPEAISEYQQLVGMPDSSLSATVGLAQLLLLDTLGRNAKSPDWTRLEQVLTVLEQTPAAANEVAILRAEMLFASGPAEAAQELLQSRIDAAPPTLSLHQALISLHVRNRHWDQAAAALAAAQQALGDTVELRLAEARILIGRDGQQVSINALDRLATPRPDWSEPQRRDLANGFAVYFFSLQDYVRCQRHAQVVAGSVAGQTDLSIHLLIFEVALRSRDAASMTESLACVKEIAGMGPLWRVGEAVRLCVQADELSDDLSPQRNSLYAMAIAHLTEASLQRPGWSRIPRLQAEIHQRRGEQDLAINEYVKAIELGEQDPQFIAQAVFLLFEQGRFVEADQIVRKLQERQSPFSSDLTKMAAQVSLQLQNFDRALQLAKAWAEKSQRQEDRIWLAQIYSITDDHAEAVKQFRIAIEIDPTAPAAWISMVQMYARAGDIESARAVLDEARSALDPAESADALAQGYETIKDFETAERYYRRGLEAQPDSAGILRRFASFYLKLRQQEQAQPLLEQLVALTGPSDAEDRAWGRRNLALSLGFTGNDEDFHRARQLLQENEDQLGITEQDQRVLASVLGSRRDSQSIQQAISILEQLVKRQAGFSIEDNFLLADLYSRTGDWTRYSRLMRGVLSHGGADDPRYVRTYAESLQDRGEYQESQLWLDRLKRLEPTQLATLTIEARQLFLANDFDRLLKLLANDDLETSLSSSNSEQTDPEQGERLWWSAEGAEVFATTLRQRGDDDQAARLFAVAGAAYAKVSESDPRRPWAYAMFLARTGQIDECLAAIADRNPAPEVLTQIVQAAMQSGRLTTAQAGQLVTRLQPELVTSQAAQIGLTLGDLYTWLGDTKAATSSYMAVLRTQADFVPALNNLAVVLASSGNRLESAQKAIDKAIAIEGPRDFLLDTRGSVLLAAGDAQAAERDFLSALEIAPNASRFFHLAQARAAQGATKDASLAMQQALELGATTDSIHPLERDAFDRLRALLQPEPN
jgi:tetratricopeptide (TPR) repeat protein